MPIRARHTRILISVALLSVLGMVTAHAPVVARMATGHDGLREAPLEGKTFRVVIVDCGGRHLDTWEFQRGGTLVGHAISASTWTQLTRVDWEGTVNSRCGFFELLGSSFGRFIVAGGFGVEPMMVVGIRQ